ncbi:MAG: SDR family NAD(P)-dependent oxidoreductase, partial [Maioricimonas sp. JB049]
MRFRNRSLIVTGGSKGIGAGCVRVFCGEGALVANLDIDTTAGEALAAELNQAGPGRVITIGCDVRDHEQIRSSIEQAVGEFGRLDCLIN